MDKLIFSNFPRPKSDNFCEGFLNKSLGSFPFEEDSIFIDCDEDADEGEGVEEDEEELEKIRLCTEIHEIRLFLEYISKPEQLN